MAETLEDGRLVIVEADQHTGYGVNRCVIDVVNDYLIDLDPPDDRHRVPLNPDCSATGPSTARADARQSAMIGD